MNRPSDCHSKAGEVVSGLIHSVYRTSLFPYFRVNSLPLYSYLHKVWNTFPFLHLLTYSSHLPSPFLSFFPSLPFFLIFLFLFHLPHSLLPLPPSSCSLIPLSPHPPPIHSTSPQCSIIPFPFSTPTLHSLPPSPPPQHKEYTEHSELDTEDEKNWEPWS